MERSDREIVEAVSGGERDAFKALVDKYQNRLYDLAELPHHDLVELRDYPPGTHLRRVTSHLDLGSLQLPSPQVSQYPQDKSEYHKDETIHLPDQTHPPQYTAKAWSETLVFH